MSDRLKLKLLPRSVLRGRVAGSFPSTVTTVIPDGNKGDITVSGDGSVWTINDGAVTYADLPNVTAEKLLGRGQGGGTGDPQEITLGSNLSMSGTTLNASAGVGTPGAPANSVQYNDGGAFGGDAGMTYDETANVLTVTGGVVTGTLSVGDGTFTLPAINNTGDDNTGIYFPSANEISLVTAANPRLSVDGTGDVYIGNFATSTAAATELSANATPVLQVNCVEAAGIVAGLFQWSADAIGARLALAKSRAATLATHTIVAANDTLGVLVFDGSDGTDFEPAAAIYGEVDGTPGANDMPGRLVFGTTADGAATVTSRLILDSTGVFKPFANDGVALGTTALSFADLFLADGGVINWGNGGVTFTHTAASDSLSLSLDAANALASTLFSVSVDGGIELTLNATALSPGVDGGLSLGALGTAWQNLFANTGFVWNIENDWIATHTAGILSVGTGVLRLTNTGLHLRDTNATHDLIIAPGSDLTADRTLTVTTGDASVTVNLTATTDEFVLAYDTGTNTWRGVAASAAVPTLITVANEAVDPTCFIAFFIDPTGDLGPKTNANLTFNAATGVVTFASAVLGTADINGGTIDGAVIGGTSASAATVTTLTVNTNANPDTDGGAGLGTGALGWSSLFLADNSVINWGNGGVTVTHTAASDSLNIALDAANTLANTLFSISVDGGIELRLDATTLSPGVDGGLSLGTGANGWQNLFANTGFALNIEAGNWIATHTTGVLTVGTGNLQVTTAGTTATSVVTVGGTQTLTNKTFDANGTGNAISNIETPDIAVATLVTSADTIAGNDTDTTWPTTAAVIDFAQPLDGTLSALALFNANGLLVQTAPDTFAGRTLTPPATGITITNPAGTAGNPTFALANDLAALEALAGTNNIYYRSGVDTWSAVTFGANITFGVGTPGEIAVSSGTATVGDGDYGDIIVSGTGTVWTIDAGVVTYAKMQDATAASVLVGRGQGAGAGDLQEITLGAGLTMTGTVLASTGGYTDEQAQDAVGTILTDSTRINFTYDDATPAITADLTVDTVDNTFLTNMAQATVKGRAAAAGTGDPTDLTGAQVLAIIEATTPIVAEATTLTAGAGLTGGGDLSANRTFTVGAGTGITVNADDVALTVPVTAILGGTGQTVYAVGDILYASSTTALSKLADVATGNALISGGVGVAPTWGKIDLTAHVTNDLPYSSLTQGTARSVLGITGNATADWAPIQGTASQVLRVNAANTALTFQSSAALTKTDDTNVTLTLGGAPTTALLDATSLTLGWTGTLAVARGGIGVGTITGLMQGNGTGAVTGVTNSSTVGQVLRVAGASTYAWGALDLADADAVTGTLSAASITGTTAQFNTALSDADFYVTGGTDVALADGGTGTTLTDPNIDRVMGWDDSAGVVKFMALADINTEAAPVSGDFLLMYDAAGNLLKTDWVNLPGATAASTTVSGISEWATTAEYLANTASRVLETNQTNAAGALTTLTDSVSGTVAWDMANGFNASLTLTGSANTRALGNPSNTVVGRTGMLVITTSGANQTLTFGTNWEAAGGSGGLPVISIVTTTKDIIFYIVQSSTSIIITGILKAVA